MLFTKVLPLLLLASLSSAYTIQSGDTYCQIAQKYGCSDWTVLQKANGYGVYTLPVGGYMNIPSSCTGYQTCYNAQVQPGDTYTSIAARYNVDATCLSNTNCNGGLYAYGTICIPTNCQNSGSVTQAPPQSGYGNYVIQSGDNYCQIAQKYGCSDWTVLQKYNQYPVYALPIGGSMTIPSTCSGTKTCKDAQVQPGDSYYTIASRYNVDVTCLATTNCNNVNDVLYAYGTICIPTNCANSGATTQAPTTTATPVQNGFANGLFYCNGYQMSVVYPPTVQNCGGVYYTNGAPANGYVGSTFYCNGVATSSTTGTCGGLYYNNGNVYTGVIGSTFYCSGVDTGSPTNSLMNCGGVNYYAGSPANGWINGQFYCNGVQSTATASNQQICGGEYYSNGSPSSGYYNGQFYCNGVATSTTTGLCSGTYYSNGAALYSCSTALYFANSESCSTFISDNPNYTEQQLINCNPSLNLSSSNCVLPQGTVMV